MNNRQGYFNLAEDLKIKSGLDKHRESKAPSLIEGEKVLTFAQAAYDGGSPFKSIWKPGYLYLTKSRLFFFQGSKEVFKIPLNCLKKIMVIERDWIPGRIVEQLFLTEENNQRKKVFYIHLKKPHYWKETIEDLMTAGAV